MRRALKLHPDFPCPSVEGIEADVAQPRPGHLVLHYIVTGNIKDLRISPVTASARADELWRHTCFELFVRPSPYAAYHEFNVSPSTQWAAYQFSEYRSGMRPAIEIPAPRVAVRSDGGRLTLEVALDLSSLPRGADWRVGLSAVIEATDGRMSYWALMHPPGQPDFHHSDCFALTLAAASPP